MAETNFKASPTLVMAHPDDEALWASSVLSLAEKVILCFEEVASQPRWTEGRRRSLETFPLNNVINLGLQESEVFGSALWPTPTATSYGLAVRLHAGSLGRYSAGRYKENFWRLVSALKPALSDCRTVVTHSPWGEYGHEEHVQVFRAVSYLQQELDFELWVPGYVSEKSYALMLQYLPTFDLESVSMKPDVVLGSKLKQLYIENECWSWFPDYQWPDQEYFFRWAGSTQAAKRTMPGKVVRMNLVWVDWVSPKRTLLPRLTRLAARVKRRLHR